MLKFLILDGGTRRTSPGAGAATRPPLGGACGLGGVARVDASRRARFGRRDEETRERDDDVAVDVARALDARMVSKRGVRGAVSRAGAVETRCRAHVPMSFIRTHVTYSVHLKRILNTVPSTPRRIPFIRSTTSTHSATRVDERGWRARRTPRRRSRAPRCALTSSADASRRR